MKSSWVAKCFVFLLGVLATNLFFIVRDAEKKEPALKNPCEREIDLTLGKAIIQSLPALDEASQFILSNRLEEAQSVLCVHIWWQLEEAWFINKKYDRALDQDLRPLLLNVYPRLKRQVDLGRFARWPKRTLVEMTNFMEEADAIVQSKP